MSGPQARRGMTAGIVKGAGGVQVDARVGYRLYLARPGLYVDYRRPKWLMGVDIVPSGLGRVGT
eukprot:5859589-Pyramimonas_sp.AAC.1